MGRLSHAKDSRLRFLEGYLDARFGRRGEALEAIKELESDPHLPQFVAHICAALGDNDGFYTWADKAIQERSFEILAVRYMKIYEDIRNDARYGGLLAKMGLNN